MKQSDGVIEIRTDVPFIQYILAFGFSCIALGWFLGPHLFNGTAPTWDAIACVTVGLAAALGLAGFRRALVLDATRGEVRRRMGWFFIQRQRRFLLADFDRIELRYSSYQSDAHTVPASEQRLSAQETSWPVYLVGTDELMLSTTSSRTSSEAEAQRIAAYFGLPLVDCTRSGGT